MSVKFFVICSYLYLALTAIFMGIYFFLKHDIIFMQIAVIPLSIGTVTMTLATIKHFKESKK